MFVSKKRCATPESNGLLLQRLKAQQRSTRPLEFIPTEYLKQRDSDAGFNFASVKCVIVLLGRPMTVAPASSFLFQSIFPDVIQSTFTKVSQTMWP